MRLKRDTHTCLHESCVSEGISTIHIKVHACKIRFRRDTHTSHANYVLEMRFRKDTKIQYSMQVKSINNINNAPEKCIILSDTGLGSNSEKVCQKLWGGTVILQVL